MYKFAKFENYSFQNLTLNQIWCNHFEAFNDPFECWCIVNKGIPDPVKDEARFLDVIKVWGFTPEMREYALEDYYFYLNSFLDDQIDVEHYLNSARICCFSHDETNLLMWAHYADGLRGFCLEIEIDPKLKDGEIIPVQYFTSPPILESISYPLANDIFWHSEDADSANASIYMRDFYLKMLATKPIEWEYEKEVRLIYHSASKNKRGEAFKYHKEAIKSVIIGEKASEVNIKNLLSILSKKKLSIPIRIAKRDVSSYRVIISDFM